MSEKKFIDVNLALELHEGKLWAWDVCDLKEFLGDVPAADVVEVVQGRWVGCRFRQNDGEYEEKCSNCGEWSVAYGRPFCPNCGAKMDGKGE